MSPVAMAGSFSHFKFGPLQFYLYSVLSPPGTSGRRVSKHNFVDFFVLLFSFPLQALISRYCSCCLYFGKLGTDFIYASISFMAAMRCYTWNIWQAGNVMDKWTTHSTMGTLDSFQLRQGEISMSGITSWAGLRRGLRPDKMHRFQGAAQDTLEGFATCLTGQN